MNFRVATLVAPDPTPPPNNDFFVSELLSNNLPVTVTGRTHDGSSPRGLGATREAGEPVHAGVGDVGSIWYTFQPLNDGPVQISASGYIGAVVAVYTGNSVASLTEVASATNDVRFYPGATVIFDASVGQTYHIAVDGQSSGGPPEFDTDYGDVTLTLTTAPEPLFTEIETLLPARQRLALPAGGRGRPGRPAAAEPAGRSGAVRRG